jgi:hypothetical protein
MKTNVHLRFALYVLLVTALCAGFISIGYTSLPLLPVLCMWGPTLAQKLIGKDQSFLFESNHPVSDRALIFGFLIFLVVFWVGMIILAHHISPGQHLMRLAWAAMGIVWLVFLYPGYRWWRAQMGVIGA